MIPYHENVTRYTLTSLSFVRPKTIIYMYVRIVYGSNNILIQTLNNIQL